MFLFLSLRESSTHPGTIEPDIPSSSAASTTSRTGLFPTKDSASRLSSSYYAWATRWDTSDSVSMLRKAVCLMALALHIPMNILSILSYGIGLWLFIGIILSVLNLICIAIGLWKLDEMRGARSVYGKIWTRHNFDYIIIALFIIYGFSFAMFVYARFNLTRSNFHRWVLFMRVIWPCLTVTDIVCFITGWIATWRDVSPATLG